MSTKQDKQAGERTQENAHLLHEHGLRPLPRTEHKQRTQPVGDTEEYRLGHHDAKMEAQAQIELLEAQRDELLAALRLVYNDKGARFGVDKATNVPISEIVRAAIAKAEGSK